VLSSLVMVALFAHAHRAAVVWPPDEGSPDVRTPREVIPRRGAGSGRHLACPPLLDSSTTPASQGGASERIEGWEDGSVKPP